MQKIQKSPKTPTKWNILPIMCGYAKILIFKIETVRIPTQWRASAREAKKNEDMLTHVLKKNFKL